MFVHTELHIRKRVFALLVLMVFLFSLLTIRIGYLTISRSEELTQRGVRQWTRSGLYRQRRSTKDIGHIFVCTNDMSDFGFIGRSG